MSPRCPKCGDPSPWHRHACERLRDLDEYHRLVGYFRAAGLPEAQAHARAEEEIIKEDTMTPCDTVWRGKTDCMLAGGD